MIVSEVVGYYIGLYSERSILVFYRRMPQKKLYDQVNPSLQASKSQVGFQILPQHKV